MKPINAAVVVVSLASGIALGMWAGPLINRTEAPVMPTSAASVALPEPPSPVATKSAARVTRAVDRPVANPFEPVLIASDASVQKVAKTVLNQGTNVELAAAGFRDAELFVSTAYAARNTGIPFMLLKHRMLTAGQTLSEAIRQSKPDIDAVAEMDRARTKARSVIAQLAS